MSRLIGWRGTIVFKRACRNFCSTPARVWAWSQRYPYESIGYGAVLLLVSLSAKPLIVIVAGVAIAGGIYQLFKPQG